MQYLDFTTLITIAIAVFILLYLRSILGQRTGHQKPDEFFEKMAQRDNENKSEGRTADNVVTLPNRRQNENTESRNPLIEEIDKMAKSGTALNKGLKEVLESDPTFSAKEFLGGAEMAYEMIVSAFADGDKKTLKNLLSSDVYQGFVGVIDDRAARNEKVKSSFVGIDDSAIKAAGMEGRNSNVTVRFESQIVSATYDKDDKLIDGDENEVVRVRDIWTFSRDTRSRDPNWKLVATEAEG